MTDPLAAWHSALHDSGVTVTEFVWDHDMRRPARVKTPTWCAFWQSNINDGATTARILWQTRWYASGSNAILVRVIGDGYHREVIIDGASLRYHPGIFTTDAPLVATPKDPPQILKDIHELVSSTVSAADR